MEDDTIAVEGEKIRYFERAGLEAPEDLDRYISLPAGAEATFYTPDDEERMAAYHREELFEDAEYVSVEGASLLSCSDMTVREMLKGRESELVDGTLDAYLEQEDTYIMVDVESEGVPNAGIDAVGLDLYLRTTDATPEWVLGEDPPGVEGVLERAEFDSADDLERKAYLDRRAKVTAYGVEYREGERHEERLVDKMFPHSTPGWVGVRTLLEELVENGPTGQDISRRKLQEYMDDFGDGAIVVEISATDHPYTGSVDPLTGFDGQDLPNHLRLVGKEAISRLKKGNGPGFDQNGEQLE
jgi:hypothetical protein